MPDDTAMSCANMAEPINLPFGLWTWVGLKETPVQLYSPDGANVSTLAPRGKYDFTVCCGDVALCHISLTTCCVSGNYHQCIDTVG